MAVRRSTTKSVRTSVFAEVGGPQSRKPRRGLGSGLYLPLPEERPPKLPDPELTSTDASSAPPEVTRRWSGLPLSSEYPAYVLPMDVFLSMDKWIPHQELLEKGLLWQAVPGRATDFIFVSHQWRGIAHPDKDGQQLRVLQAAVQGLIDGNCKVRLDFVGQIHSLTSSGKFDDRRAWNAARFWQTGLKQGFIWIDYISVPQPSVETEPAARQEAKDKMWKAARSIISYVSMASCFVILAPPVSRTDPPKQPINYGTWQRRGWCLMERACWALSFKKALHSASMLLIEDMSVITLESAETILMTTLGTAEWTRPQDLQQLAPLMQKLLMRKRRQCHQVDDAEGLCSISVSEGRHLQRLCEDEKALLALAALPSITSGAHVEEKAVVIANFLSECGLDRVTSQDPLGRSPLHVAAARGEADSISMLLNFKADTKAKTRSIDTASRMPAGATAVHFIAAWCTKPPDQAERSLQLLLEARMSVDPVGRLENPPLHVAAGWNNETMASLLLKHRASIDRHDAFGLTALGVAVVHASTEVVQLLLERRAGLEQGSFFWTREPFFDVAHLAACSSSAASILPTLLEARADLNTTSKPLYALLPRPAKLLVRGALRFGGYSARTVFFFRTFLYDGITPLMVAACSGNVQAVQDLVLNRANPHLKSRRGRTALELASLADEKDNSSMLPAIKYLLREGWRVRASNSGLLSGGWGPMAPMAEVAPSTRDWIVKL